MSLNSNNSSLSPLDFDQPTLRSYCLGVTLSLLCMPGLIGNVLVSYVEISKGLLSSNNSSMYNLSFNLIVADTIHLAVLAFYLGPASALQSWLLPDDWTREIPARILIVCWHNMLIDLCLLGLNRYVLLWKPFNIGPTSTRFRYMAVCRPQQYTTAFSKRNTRKMIIFSWLAGFVLCLIGEQLVPCCA